jgi:hypothetical protein
LQTEWHTPDADRERIDRARQEAENLFRPKPMPRSLDPPEPNGSAPTDLHPRREPRVFRILPVIPMAAAKGDPPAPRVRAPRQPTERRETRRIPASQFGRVRALARYGMTHAQVAELYGVSIDAIERIIAQPDSARTA